MRIYTGEAEYWSREDNQKGGGPPTSWDFSMRVLGLPYWGVHVKPGDILRSNATYDTTQQATYENMGIAVSLFVPNKEDGTPRAPGVNPFQVRVDRSKACRSGGLRARKGAPVSGRLPDARPLPGERQLRRCAGRVEREAGCPRARSAS